MGQSQVPLEDVEPTQDSGMQVALPRLDVVVGVVPETRKIGGHWSMVLHQGAEDGLIRLEVLIEIMPFAKLYLFAFSSGKD